MVNTKLLVKVKELLDLGVHYGSVKSGDDLQTFVLGYRNKKAILDISVIFFWLNLLKPLVKNLARVEGKFFFYDCEFKRLKILRIYAQRAGSFYLKRKWVPGTLTNSNYVLKRKKLRSLSLSYKQKFVSWFYEKPLFAFLLNVSDDVLLHELELMQVPIMTVLKKRNALLIKDRFVYVLPGDPNSNLMLSLYLNILVYIYNKEKLYNGSIYYKKERSNFYKYLEETRARFYKFPLRLVPKVMKLRNYNKKLKIRKSRRFMEKERLFYSKSKDTVMRGHFAEAKYYLLNFRRFTSKVVLQKTRFIPTENGIKKNIDSKFKLRFKRKIQ